MKIEQILDFTNQANLINYMSKANYIAGRYFSNLIKNGEVEKVLGKTVIFFAFLDETPCGFISLSEKDITCLDIESKHNITTLFVDKIARGQGLGETLIKTVIEYARQNQIDQIDAYTEFDGLYEKAGFIFLKEKVDSWNRPLRHYQIKL